MLRPRIITRAIDRRTIQARARARAKNARRCLIAGMRKQSFPRVIPAGYAEFRGCQVLHSDTHVRVHAFPHEKSLNVYLSHPKR